MLDSGCIGGDGLVLGVDGGARRDAFTLEAMEVGGVDASIGAGVFVGGEGGAINLRW